MSPENTLKLGFIVAPIVVFLTIFGPNFLESLGGEGTVRLGGDDGVHSADLLLRNAECVRSANEFARNSTIYFEPRSAELSTEGMNLVRELSEIVNRCPNLVVHVYGHSNVATDDISADRLSWRRGEQVLQFLSSDGRDITQFRIFGVGSRESIYMGSTGQETELDDRVEFEVFERFPNASVE
ncbi:MAG: OmpA family protein [Sulfitobacter sp.]